MAANPVPSIPPDAGAGSFAECLSAVAHARECLAGLRGVTWQASGGQLAEVLGELGELALLVDAAEVAVVADAVDRGEPASGVLPLSPTDWVAQHSRRYPSGRLASPLVKLAQGIPAADLAPPCLDTEADTDPGDADSDPTGPGDAGWGAAGTLGAASGSGRLPGCLREAVLTAAVPRAAAVTAAAEMTRLLPRLVPDAVGVVWQAYTDYAATTSDPTEVRRLRPALLARHGLAQENTDDEHRAHTPRHAVARPGRRGRAHRLPDDPGPRIRRPARIGPVRPVYAATGHRR
ncbi:MAG: hypothetical protein LKG20_05725 [Tetrasphaera jenkinsii]|nr:hypothetical protein [Tetrasphaera jenkinsii]